MDIVWFIIIGIVAGWLAGKIMRGAGFGLLGDLVIGIIGALLGGYIFGALGISAGGLIREPDHGDGRCDRAVVPDSPHQTRLTCGLGLVDRTRSERVLCLHPLFSVA
jgi:uncharacterized membrane protein YeaQ/YmgE (transglycosylase-associated protein family)